MVDRHSCLLDSGASGCGGHDGGVSDGEGGATDTGERLRALLSPSDEDGDSARLLSAGEPLGEGIAAAGERRAACSTECLAAASRSSLVEHEDDDDDDDTGGSREALTQRNCARAVSKASDTFIATSHACSTPKQL